MIDLSSIGVMPYFGMNFWGNWVNDDGAMGSAWPGRAWLWLSAWLGSVTLGRQRRSLDSDLDISTYRSEISGKVARPFFGGK